MSKAPPNVPTKGDCVRQRGRPGREGRAVKHDPNGNWMTIEWKDGRGPKYCHRYELEAVK